MKQPSGAPRVYLKYKNESERGIMYQQCIAITVVLLSFNAGCSSTANLPSVARGPQAAPAGAVWHVIAMENEWAIVLKSVVTKDGWVRWDRVQANDKQVRDHLSKLIEGLRDFSPDTNPDEFPDGIDGARYSPASLATPHRAAFWANAYNAISMQWVIQNAYPRVIPWKREGKWNIAGRQMTLDDIEQMLAPECGMFLLNSCMVSSPPMSRTPFHGDKLAVEFNSQLVQCLSEKKDVENIGDEIRVSERLVAYRDRLIRGGPIAIQGDLWRTDEVKLNSLFLRTLCIMAQKQDEHWESKRLVVAPIDRRINCLCLVKQR